MALADALSTARASIAHASLESTILARNISGANEPGYARRGVEVISGDGDDLRAVVVRASSEGLQRAMLDATASAARASTMSDGLDRLQAVMGDGQLEGSPSWLISKLQTSLQDYAASPADPNLGVATVQSARDLESGLNAAAKTVLGVRRDADKAISASVSYINTSLTELTSVDAAIVAGRTSGRDLSNHLDRRDQLIAAVAEEVGISVIHRADGGVTLTTDSGLVLFNRTARSVAFTQTGAFAPDTRGAAVLIDGADATSVGAPMAIRSGKLAGLIQVRDEATVSLQTRLDDVANAVADVFAEQDQTNPSAPPKQGAFLIDDASATSGAALRIRINPTIEREAGGDPTRLRDGGASAPGDNRFVYNTARRTDYGIRLSSLSDALSATQDANGETTNPLDVANETAAWFETLRASSEQEHTSSATLISATNDALTKAVGVSLDDQLTHMLDVERSYQTSAKLLAAIDSMLGDLMQAVR